MSEHSGFTEVVSALLTEHVPTMCEDANVAADTIEAELPLRLAAAGYLICANGEANVDGKIVTLTWENGRHASYWKWPES